MAQRKEGKPSLQKHTMPDITTFEGNWPAQPTQQSSPFAFLLLHSLTTTLSRLQHNFGQLRRGVPPATHPPYCKCSYLQLLIKSTESAVIGNTMCTPEAPTASRSKARSPNRVQGQEAVPELHSRTDHRIQVTSDTPSPPQTSVVVMDSSARSKTLFVDSGA